jgi:hypothetical protein
LNGGNEEMKIVIIFICLSFVLHVFGEKLTTLPLLQKPENFIVGENLICINKGAEVFLYNLNDFKFIKKFGRNGEGPEEFKPFFPLGLRINLLKEKIMIESQGKLSFYTLKGELIKEMPLLPTYSKLELLEDRFIATSGILSNKISHNVAKILDVDFIELKTFYHDEAKYHQEKQGTNYASTWIYDVSETKCFIVGSSDFKIDVFNKNGDSLYYISLKYNRLKFSQDFINAWFRRIKKRLGMNAYDYMKKKVRWPEFFPAISDMIVDDGHVYVITWQRKEEKSETFIFNLEGKLVEKTWLPLKNYDGVVFFPYSIDNNCLYQLIENEDTQEWELHRFSIL